MYMSYLSNRAERLSAKIVTGFLSQTVNVSGSLRPFRFKPKYWVTRAWVDRFADVKSLVSALVQREKRQFYDRRP